MARSRELTGPYELHPDIYILTSRHRPDIELQRAGHADLVETQSGETYMVHLCGRPLRNRGRCTLGRETAIQRMVWGDDGWLRTADGEGVPHSEVLRRRCRRTRFPHAPAREDFDEPRTAAGFPVAALAVAGGTVQPDGASRVICACTAARRWAACSGRPWWRGASSRTASAPRR